MAHLNFQKLSQNKTRIDILTNFLMASVALFFNGFGLYLTMKAGIGAAPWDVFNLGISKTFGVLYGTASITVAFIILIIDVLLKEPIGLAMIIDSIVVGKAVDFFNYIDFVPSTDNIPASILTLVAGLFVMGYTQLFYMRASLGCGPRDTLLVGLSKRIRKIPIGVVAIGLLSAATLTGYLLGGPVGLGTILCAVFQGPIMQFAFKTFSFDATTVKHQSISESIKVFAHRTA